MWPFGLLALAAGLQALNLERADVRLRFCLAWYIPFWLFFELIPTKLPHYVLPAYPALALLIGWALTLPLSEANAPLRIWQIWLSRLAAFGLAVVTVGLAVLCVAAPLYLVGTFVWWSIPAAAAVLLAGYFAFSTNLAVPLHRIGAAAASAAVAYVLLFGVIVPSLTPMWLSPRIAQAFEAIRPCDNSVLASVGFHEPSLVFLVGTKTLLTDTQGAARHLLADPACAMALVPVQDGETLKNLLRQAGKIAAPVALVEGINYSSGDVLSLVLYHVSN
jgi:4-amino-4-deoxy-L-arabinose transferase-like glycosyltransferase